MTDIERAVQWLKDNGHPSWAAEMQRQLMPPKPDANGITAAPTTDQVCEWQDKALKSGDFHRCFATLAFRGGILHCINIKQEAGNGNI